MVLAFDTSRVRVAITPVGRNDSIRLSMPYEATGRYTLFISHALGVPDMGAVHKMRLSTLSFSDSFDATFLHANPQYFDQAGDIINSVPDSLQTLQRCELHLDERGNRNTNVRTCLYVLETHLVGVLVMKIPPKIAGWSSVQDSRAQYARHRLTIKDDLPATINAFEKSIHLLFAAVGRGVVFVQRK